MVIFIRFTFRITYNLFTLFIHITISIAIRYIICTLALHLKIIKRFYQHRSFDVMEIQMQFIDFVCAKTCTYRLILDKYHFSWIDNLYLTCYWMNLLVLVFFFFLRCVLFTFCNILSALICVRKTMKKKQILLLSCGVLKIKWFRTTTNKR